jgi:phenylalanyl-tRNA synthetase alpha chain
VDADAYRQEALTAVASATSVGELDEARVRYLGRKSELKQALREVRDRESGMALNAAREAIEEAIASCQQELERAELDRALTEERIDITLPGEAQRRGRLHVITQIRREVEDIFLGMGYEVVEGREVETTRYLFDALNMPPNHPTRSPLHTFFLNGDVVLRTETSPAQIHTMERQEPPVFMVSLGRCYRRDTADATHYPIFHQVEGLAVAEGITLADLKGTLRHLLRSLFGEDREARFATDFFPFTEPSLGVSVSCFLCDGAGCRVCKHTGWIEIGGSGMVDPNVLEFVGYDPEKVSGFAFGWGLERMAILRHGLPDIRALWENDLRLLEQFA